MTAAVPGRPAVLYVEGNTSRASYLASALSAQEFDVDVRAPRELPSSLRELERYDFVILSDAPAEAVSLTQQDAIEGYVRDMGGGFLFAGGESGYGLGGWYHTTIERILPVRMDSEKKKDEPGVAMVLVIDRSGSMSGPEARDGEGRREGDRGHALGDDMLEVIAFDSSAEQSREDDEREVSRAHPERHRAHSSRRRHGDLQRARRGLSVALDHARPQEAHHPPHGRPSADATASSSSRSRWRPRA